MFTALAFRVLTHDIYGVNFQDRMNFPVNRKMHNCQQQKIYKHFIMTSKHSNYTDFPVLHLKFIFNQRTKGMKNKCAICENIQINNSQRKYKKF